MKENFKDCIEIEKQSGEHLYTAPRGTEPTKSNITEQNTIQML